MTARELIRLAPVAVLLLAGCQALPRAVPPVADGTPAAEAFDARRTQLAALDAWTLRGRSALSARGRGWNGSVHWHQSADYIDLRLIAPLGAGTLRLTGLPEYMRIRASDGTDFYTPDPAGDLEAALGAPLPIGALRWWILGIPLPDVAVEALDLDAAGRATAFMQEGWHVTYPRYTEHDGFVVPGIVAAERDGAKIRVVVDQWSAQ
ncbi:MAG: lipoprotein insertase outer membrane protein LolB [Gammaproteobacteria bacterium]